MDGSCRSWLVLVLVLTAVVSGAWREERREQRREERREPRDPREQLRRSGVHFHSKRHMLPQEPEKKRVERTTAKPTLRELRKKPSGHLTPLEDDDMENDEVVSVAIGPPPMRPKFDKNHRKQFQKPSKPQPPNNTAVTLIRDVLAELGREFLTRDMNENFVFGQYVGNAMRNLTNENRLSMQHEILDLILKFQSLKSNDVKREDNSIDVLKNNNRIEKKYLNPNGNETEESWPDFSNLAKIVG